MSLETWGRDVNFRCFEGELLEDGPSLFRALFREGDAGDVGAEGNQFADQILISAVEEIDI